MNKTKDVRKHAWCYSCSKVAETKVGTHYYCLSCTKGLSGVYPRFVERVDSQILDVATSPRYVVIAPIELSEHPFWDVRDLVGNRSSATIGDFVPYAELTARNLAKDLNAIEDDKAMPTVGDVFTLAADIIEQFGWLRYKYEDGNKRNAVAAINTAVHALAPARPNDFRVNLALSLVANQAFFEATGYSGWWWNSAPERTRYEVTTLFWRLAEEHRR